MITMKDVARLANVSPATVSAVVNEKLWVSDRLAQRVRKAMDDLDYHPDHVARSLKVGRTHVIGMIVPDVTNPFYTEITRGVEEIAKMRGYTVMLCDANEEPDQEQEYLRMLQSRRVDGVILASSVSHAGYDLLARRRFPVVFVDAVPAGITEGIVTTNNLDAAYKATRHLIELGHRRIAIITGKLSRSVATDRLAGYRKAMNEVQLPIPEDYIRFGDFHIESGYRSGVELMKLASPPTAVFVCNNRMTLGFMRALAELGISCPERVSVICFDDADWATSLTPKMTCVAQPSLELGRRSAELLLEKVGASNNGPEQSHPPVISLDAELCIRGSTANFSFGETGGNVES